jgi:hypothetical protein
MHLRPVANLWVAYQSTMTDKGGLSGLSGPSPSSAAEQSTTKESSDGSNRMGSATASSSGLGDKGWVSNQYVKQSTKR